MKWLAGRWNPRLLQHSRGRNDPQLQRDAARRTRPGFALKSRARDQAVFENPKKDFPARITFHRTAPDRLLITLSEIAGEKRRVFDLKRAP